MVNQGKLNYNDRHIPLDGEVHDLHAQVAFDPAKIEYDGILDYREGTIHFGTYTPIQTGLQVRFGATPSGLTLHSLILSAGSSSISAQGHLQDYSSPSIDGSYQAALSTVELARIVNAGSIPSGQVELQGTLHYQTRTDHPMVDNVTVSGKFASSNLAIASPQAHADIRDLGGMYELRGGSLDVRDVKADVLGGRLAGNLTLTNFSERPVGRVAVALSDISLEVAGSASDTRPLQRAAITGRLNGTAEASWEGSGENLKARADATIAASAPLGPTARTGANAIPLQGALHATYDGPSGTLTLTDTNLATPHLTVKLDGSTGKQSHLGIQAQCDDLHEIDQIMLIARHAMTNGRSSSPPAEPLGIGGSASFQGQLQGSVNNLHLTGRLTSSNLQYRQTVVNDDNPHRAPALAIAAAFLPHQLSRSAAFQAVGDKVQFLQRFLGACPSEFSMTSVSRRRPATLEGFAVFGAELCAALRPPIMNAAVANQFAGIEEGAGIGAAKELPTPGAGDDAKQAQGVLQVDQGRVRGGPRPPLRVLRMVQAWLQDSTVHAFRIHNPCPSKAIYEIASSNPSSLRRQR